jgi:catechol 2,3-dioxygenase-like lactoylglutathione lyase family enzyme
MNYNLNYIRLLTDKFDEMWDFYVEKMGMTPRFGKENNVYEEFRINGATLSIYKRDYMGNALGTTLPKVSTTPQDTFVIILQVLNVDKIYLDLKDKVKFLTKPLDREEWIIRTAHVRDPDGNLIELNEPIKKE